MLVINLNPTRRWCENFAVQATRRSLVTELLSWQRFIQFHPANELQVIKGRCVCGHRRSHHDRCSETTTQEEEEEVNSRWKQDKTRVRQDHVRCCIASPSLIITPLVPSLVHGILTATQFNSSSNCTFLVSSSKLSASFNAFFTSVTVRASVPWLWVTKTLSSSHSGS